MTLTLAIKCSIGLILAADSRRVDVNELGVEIVGRSIDKILTFHEPYNNIGVLVAGDLSQTAGFDFGTLSRREEGYSIEQWVRLFGTIELSASDQSALSVEEFANRLAKFLIQRWENARFGRLKTRNIEEQAKKDRFFSRPLTVIAVIAGLDEGEEFGRIFPLVLTDLNNFQDGQTYLPQGIGADLIANTCGIFSVGETQFVTEALGSDDFLSKFLADPAQPSQEGYEEVNERNAKARIERLKIDIPEIEDFKRRFKIRAVGKSSELCSVFASDGLSTQDAERIAVLLVRGATQYSRGLVGGSIRVCNVEPTRGIRCKWEEQLSPPYPKRLPPK